MLEQFLRHIEKFDLVRPGDKILLAVSGGVDSMVMVDLFARGGFVSGVAHCNFRLRGTASDGDEDFVRGICEAGGLPCYVTRFDTATYAHNSRVSVQMAARQLRYEWFARLCREAGYDRVATAHHAGDSVETIVMNLIKGAGIGGLTGIPVKTEHIIRPMLFARKSELLAYARQRGIRWRDDASNDDPHYQRNFIRKTLLPQMAVVNPDVENGILRSQEKLSGTRRLLDLFVDSFRRRAVRHGENELRIDRGALQETGAGPVLLLELVRELGFNYEQCKLVLNPHQAGRIFYSKTHRITVDRLDLVIGPKGKKDLDIVLIEEPAGLVDGFGQRLKLEVREGTDYVVEKQKELAQLDLGKVEFPIYWRTWSAGDSFVPLGMRQTRKVSDLLIDLKFSRPDKEQVTVLESAGSIVCVVGVQIADPYKVTASSRRVLRIEMISRNNGSPSI